MAFKSSLIMATPVPFSALKLRANETVICSSFNSLSYMSKFHCGNVPLNGTVTLRLKMLLIVGLFQRWAQIILFLIWITFGKLAKIWSMIYIYFFVIKQRL